MTERASSLRQGGAHWKDYVLGRGEEVDALFVAASSRGRLVVIMGDGFDPRSLHTMRRLADLGLHARIVQIPLPRGPGHGAGTTLAENNRRELTQLASVVALDRVDIAPPADSDRLSVGSRISRQLVKEGIVEPGDSVVVDISALPSRVFFPVIGTLLELARKTSEGELLVTVSENPTLDGKIISNGVDDAGTITGFAHGFSADPDDNRITLWAPVVGEKSGPELEAIYDFLRQPQEIYPILPFPAVNPRRADDLVLEHRVLLFDRFEVDPRNILYVHESNAFDTYRVITTLFDRSSSLLGPVGDVQLVVSTHASKMLSTGVCLAAWESKLPVVTACSTSFGIESAPDATWVSDTSVLCCLWLQGSPYR